MTTFLVIYLWLVVGCLVLFSRLQHWGILPRLTWRDALAVALVVVLWPILVVF